MKSDVLGQVVASLEQAKLTEQPAQTAPEQTAQMRFALAVLCNEADPSVKVPVSGKLTHPDPSVRDGRGLPRARRAPFLARGPAHMAG